MNKEIRGSEKLLKAYEAGGFKLDEELINELAMKLDEVDLHNLFIKGQPNPDFLRATFAFGGRGKAGAAVIDELMGMLDKPNRHLPAEIRVFPRGIPWPGEFMVDVTVGRYRY